MYSKLPSPRFIRLLDIAPGKASDRVEVSLMVVDLDAWGSSSNPVDILSDGQVISVTQNLHGALLRLRKPHQIRRAWSDALCINQNDLDERSHQVSFMRDIYSRAKHVVVWLGPDEDGRAALATSIINSTVDSMKDGGKIAAGQSLWNKDEEEYQLKLRERLPPRDHAYWQAVWWLFRREWFSRVWIIQEVSQDLDSIVKIGDHSVSYYRLGMTAVVFSLRRYAATTEDWYTLQRVMGVYGSVVRTRMSDQQPSLLNILSIFSGFKATDPRDKLYALIGLSKEGENLEKHPLIKPDYRKTVVQTYIDLVRQLISSPRGQDYGEGGLDVLGRTDIARYRAFMSSPATNEQEVFPSWVPQFHQSSPWHPSISTQKQTVNYAASYDSAVQSGPVSSSGSLVLRGVRLGTVAKVYNNLRYYAGRSLGLAGLFEEVKKDLTNYQGPGCVAEAFAQAVTAGNSDATSEKDVVRLLSESLRDYISKKNSVPLPNNIISGWHYRMFLTDDGYLGLGAPSVLGSELWLLFGGRTLYILHRDEDCYAYIGECFVHGFMNGEGMELWKAGKLESEWVDLR